MLTSRVGTVTRMSRSSVPSAYTASAKNRDAEPVGVHRDGDRRVPQHLLHCFGVDAFGEEQRGAGVSQVVEPFVGEPCPLEQRLLGAVVEIVDAPLVPNLRGKFTPAATI